MKLYATMRVVLTVDDSKLNDTQGEGLEAAARDYLVEALTLYIPEADCAIVDVMEAEGNEASDDYLFLAEGI